MKVAVCAVLFSLLFAASLAALPGVLDTHKNVIVKPNNVDQLCGLIGVNSGCSGCVLGTKNLCSYVAMNVQDTKRSAEAVDYSSPVQFKCVSKATAEEMILANQVEDVSAMCPSDPSKEPIIRAVLSQARGDISLAKAASINSTAFTDEMASFPRAPWAVDRTSFWEQAGAAYSADFFSRITDQYDCATLVSKARSLQGCPLFRGFVEDENDKHCARIYLAAAIATRCPAYGVAVSGVCQGLMKKVWSSCASNLALIGSPSRHYSFPTVPYKQDAGQDTQTIGAVPFYPLAVVPDDTPFCLNEFAVQPSGALEALYGLNKESASYCPPPPPPPQ